MDKARLYCFCHPGDLAHSVHRIQYCFATFFVIELFLRVVADGRNFFCGEETAGCSMECLRLQRAFCGIVNRILFASLKYFDLCPDMSRHSVLHYRVLTVRAMTGLSKGSHVQIRFFW